MASVDQERHRRAGDSPREIEGGIRAGAEGGGAYHEKRRQNRPYLIPDGTSL